MSKAPPHIIILGTGRSFTSVVSCMIGQHPDMIGLPETNIFVDPTLGEVCKRFGGRSNAYRRAGLLRTLAHFHDGAQTDETIAAAEKFLTEHGDWTATEIAAHIAKLAAPRGIVEKSISTSRKRATLNRALEAWPEAYFLHITRQPESIVLSMLTRIEGIMEKGKGGRLLEQAKDEVGLDHYFNRRSTAILSFMATLPPGKGMNLHGENFLTDARCYARQICEWTGLDASDAAIDAMMHPENNPFAFPGPATASGGLSKSFLDNPTYSGKPVTVKPMSFNLKTPDLTAARQTLTTLGNRLGYP